MDLGAVETDRAKLEQLHLLGQFEHLDKQAFQFAKKAAAKVSQRVVIGMAAGGDVAEGHRVIRGALKPSAGEHARGVAIDQDRQQCGRMVCFRAASGVLPGETGKIQLVYRPHWTTG